MSDSPLDGGSGWPTSAYAIVPRQPTSPAAEAAPPAEPAEADAAEQPDVSEAPEQRSRAGRISALVIGVIVLIIAAVGGVLATRDKTGSGTTATGATTQAPAPTTGAPAVAAGNPSTSTAGSADASAAGSAGTSAGPSASGGAEGSASASGAVPSGEATTTTPAITSSILRSGTAQLVVLAGQPDEAYDFDSAAKQAAGADATAGAVLATVDTPSLAACSAIPAERWMGQITLAGVLPGSKVCVRTSEQRYAWFMTRAGEPVAGALLTANLDFVVYKKSGD
jgi:hypothetical protein